MDWIRLGNSGVDLTGVGGVPQVVTLSELANHNKQTDAWIAIRGSFISTLLKRKLFLPSITTCETFNHQYIAYLF